MSRSAFRRLLRHRCTIERAIEGAVDAHGQAVVTWAVLDMAVPCLFMAQPGAMRPGREIRDRTQDVLLVDYVLFMECRDVRETDRVRDIAWADGRPIQAGPLNIRHVNDAGGQGHHLEVHVVSGVNVGGY